MHYGLIFSCAKQCKTVQDKLTTTYLLPEQMTKNTKLII